MIRLLAGRLAQIGLTLAVLSFAMFLLIGLMPGDPIDTTPLARRFDALGHALDDLPRQALRFARWRVRTAHAASFPRHAATQGKAAGRVRFRRVWPLRPGRPAGRRPMPDRGPSHEVHVILEDTHGLAMLALEAPDTS